MNTNTTSPTEMPFPCPLTDTPEGFHEAQAAWQRGNNKSRARKLYQKLLRRQLIQLHSRDYAADPQSWLKAASWATVLAFLAGQPGRAARICRKALAQSPPRGMMQQ